MADEIIKLVGQAIDMLREGMDASGTSTFHYHKMREAIDVLKQITDETQTPTK